MAVNQNKLITVS